MTSDVPIRPFLIGLPAARLALGLGCSLLDLIHDNEALLEAYAACAPSPRIY